MDIHNKDQGTSRRTPHRHTWQAWAGVNEQNGYTLKWTTHTQIRGKGGNGINEPRPTLSKSRLMNHES